MPLPVRARERKGKGARRPEEEEGNRRRAKEPVMSPSLSLPCWLARAKGEEKVTGGRIPGASKGKEDKRIDAPEIETFLSDSF